jgi:uncharacterized membrane protein
MSPADPGRNSKQAADHPTTGRHAKEPRATCAVCGKEFSRSHLTRLTLVRPALVERMRVDHPELPADGLVCDKDITRFRSQYVSDLLRDERGDLSLLDQQVIESLLQGEMISANVAADFEGHRSVGERLSDRLASFGGSWTFIILFGVVLVAWITVNAVLLGQAQFDPYPFILLNLVLSCLAAIQAPVILMSQNRQEVKDRLRAENDYRVNLKAELEIRHLHEKIDHLINRQWERLAEIQEIQLEIMQDIAGRQAK